MFSFFASGSASARADQQPAGNGAGVRIVAEKAGAAYRLLLPRHPAQEATDGAAGSGEEGDAIPFTLRRGTRRRTRLAIRVRPEGDVEVLLPRRAGIGEALDAVHRRAEWIARHVRAARARPRPEPLRYVSGETHFYLGRPLALEVLAPEKGKTPGRARPERVRLEKERLCVRPAAPGPEAVSAALRAWYRAQAARFFAERLDLLCADIAWLRARPPLRLRAMRRRWGSCTRKGVLTLNTHLIKAPARCIDYVLLHEIAHLRELNHSPRYYALLEQLLPDWKAVRRELECRAPVLLAG